MGADEAQIAACEMPVPVELEEGLVEEMGDAGEKVVAFALAGERLNRSPDS